MCGLRAQQRRFQLPFNLICFILRFAASGTSSVHINKLRLSLYISSSFLQTFSMPPLFQSLLNIKKKAFFAISIRCNSKTRYLITRYLITLTMGFENRSQAQVKVQAFH